MTAAFRDALTDPARPVPAGLIAPGGRPAGNRFDVYRNNVAVSLTEALAADFPAVRALVGEEFFAAMAGVFLRAHPPRSPVLAQYGGDLPGFLEGFAPAASLPYLPDIARLELALRAAYHAADAMPVPPEALARIAPGALPGLRLAFVPALRLLRSDWPVRSIWRAATDPAAPRPVMRPEAVVIARPVFDPVTETVSPDAAAILDGLIGGAPLGEAAAGREAALPEILGHLVTLGAIAAIHPATGAAEDCHDTAA